MAVSTVPVAPGRDHYRPAGDCDPLAPTRFPHLLALEISPRRRPSTDQFRNSSADPADEPREPAVGRTADPWRIVDAWIEVAESTVGKYMVRRRRPPFQGWKTFLRNHVAGIASLDLFVVRTISFKLLYGLVILRHARRRIITISVTSNPTAAWLAGQVTDAFPRDEGPRHLIRDRDAGLRPSPHSSPWDNGDPRSSDRAALTVAERPRRALHRLDPAGKPRSLGRVRRSAFASRFEELLFLLQPGPDASLIGQECAGLSASAEDRPYRSNTNSRRASSSIRPGLATVLKVEEGALPAGSTGSGIE
jgi:hypothetical protein